MAKNTIKASTQKFTGIVDIVDTVVLLEGGYAASVIEVTATNFALLSKREQDAKIYSYAALLNSLSFPIQIVIKNQRVDISSYIKTLQEQEQSTHNQLLSNYIKLYREFVTQMLKINIVLNKEFYIVITYSVLEQGVKGTSSSIKTSGKNNLAFAQNAKQTLSSRADSILNQLRRLSVSAKLLSKEELVKLYYNIYNQDLLEVAQISDDIQTPIVTTKT